MPLCTSCEPADNASQSGPLISETVKNLGYIGGMALPNRKMVLKINYAPYAFLHFTFGFSLLFEQTKLG